MWKGYNKNLNGRRIKRRELKRLTGHSFDEWCSLTGLFVSPFPEDFISKGQILIRGEYPKFKMRAENKNVKFDIEVDLLNGIIFTENFLLRDTGKKRATAAFSEHLRIATAMGFIELQCLAYGGLSEQSNKKYFHGYYTWAKFGFTMSKLDERKFIEKMILEKSDDRCLQRLIRNKQGLDIWKRVGDMWLGHFDLKEKSINRRIWNLYLKGWFN